jgi:hypothetical protein
MAQDHERLFYEVMWRLWRRERPYPLPWWVQQTLRAWSDNYDGGLFDSKEAAFASNALYRYWSMVGVKDAGRETLVGQAGEVEPVYDQYAMCFFVFDPPPGACTCPSSSGPGRAPPSRRSSRAATGRSWSRRTGRRTASRSPSGCWRRRSDHLSA